MRRFSDFIEVLALVDLPLLGDSFTCSNNRDTPSCSKLDRLLLSLQIWSAWPDLFHSVLPRGISDHNLVALYKMESGWGPRPFKWFDYLGDDKGFAEKVQEVCLKHKGVGIGLVLQRCKDVSNVWVKEVAGKYIDKIKESKHRCVVLDHNLIAGVQVQESSFELRKERLKLWEFLEEMRVNGFRIRG
ncbi:hypothetical protein V6N13_104337 [Hibiscus sabdariffa]